MRESEKKREQERNVKKERKSVRWWERVKGKYERKRVIEWENKKDRERVWKREKRVSKKKRVRLKERSKKERVKKNERMKETQRERESTKERERVGVSCYSSYLNIKSQISSKYRNGVKDKSVFVSFQS